ncbi:hypothetical protein GCM10022223_02660 [Kineosporia mesophila]|uniref:Uncharacterized protein n=1 Tax=Kineosporia mesophila TaxID=566012 RepID=A0ABP6YUH1_9ACTN
MLATACTAWAELITRAPTRASDTMTTAAAVIRDRRDQRPNQPNLSGREDAADGRS